MIIAVAIICAVLGIAIGYLLGHSAKTEVAVLKSQLEMTKQALYGLSPQPFFLFYRMLCILPGGQRPPCPKAAWGKNRLDFYATAGIPFVFFVY